MLEEKAEDVIVNERIPVNVIIPHPDNYNQHSPQQIENLRESLRTFGQVESVAVQACADGVHYLCVAGHGVREAAVLEGFTYLRADIIPADWPPHKVKAYLVAANEHARQSDPDFQQLQKLVTEGLDVGDITLPALGFTDQAELDALLAAAERMLTPDERAARVGSFLDDYLNAGGGGV